MNDLWFLVCCVKMFYCFAFLWMTVSFIYQSHTHKHISLCFLLLFASLSLPFIFPKLCFTPLQKHTIVDVDTILFFHILILASWTFRNFVCCEYLLDSFQRLKWDVFFNVHSDILFSYFIVDYSWFTRFC